MGKYKTDPRYNVLSIRISDEEKAVMDEIRQHTNKNISTLMREALLLFTNYSPNLSATINRGY